MTWTNVLLFHSLIALFVQAKTVFSEYNINILPLKNVALDNKKKRLTTSSTKNSVLNSSKTHWPLRLLPSLCQNRFCDLEVSQVQEDVACVALLNYPVGWKFSIKYDDTYSGCQKYESSPIFVTKLEVRLYPEFLNTQFQTCTFGLQICTLSTRTCTFCSTIASDFSTLTFLAHLLTTLINLVLYKHEHEG